MSNNKENTKLQELLNIQEEHSKIEKEEKELKDYLDINVFNYANNKEKLEDIFEIKNSNLRFIDQIKNSKIIGSNVPILDINHLTKYYGNKSVPTLINVSVKVYLGDVHVVVGNCGSGKTTLFNCIKGLEPYEGEILIDGSIKKSISDFSNLCGFVSFNHSWDLFQTVEECLFNDFQELKINDAYAKKYIRSALEQFNLSDLRNTPIIDISLLELRKIQLISSLVNDPHLIILDQPLLGLQHFEKLDLLILIAKLRNKTRSIVIFSHELEEISAYANTITLLVKGKVYFSGLIKDLMLSSYNKYAISVENMTLATEILNKIGCEHTVNELKNVIYASFDGSLNVLLFQKECADKNLIIKEFKLVNISVEDLYPALLKSGTKDAILDINKLNYFSPN